MTRKVRIEFEIPDSPSLAIRNDQDLSTEEIIDLIPLLNLGITDFLANIYRTHGSSYISKIIMDCVAILSSNPKSK